MTRNGAPTVAVPLTTPPPVFCTVKVRSSELPAATPPKDRELGVTLIVGGGTVIVAVQRWTGTSASHRGATRGANCEGGRGALEGMAKTLLLKFTFPLLPTNRVLKLPPPPKRIGNGEVIAADESSPKSRLVPVIIR